MGRDDLGELGLRADRWCSVWAWPVAGGPAQTRQFFAAGQTEVATGADVEAALFVALQKGPLVSAEELPGGDAVLVAQWKSPWVTVGQVTLGEGVQTQQLLLVP